LRQGERAALRGCERGNRYAVLEHDLEKWMLVPGEDHAPPKG
jgi:hypothetical protein